MATITRATIIATVNALETAKTSEIVAIFNAHSDKPVKRFSDRKTAIKRTTDLLLAIAAELPQEAAKKETGAKPTLSESIAKSWNNPETAARRLTRHGVIAFIDDKAVPFGSLRKAFAALRLPDSKHIAFRQVLKAKGEATFTFGKTSVKFALSDE